MTDIEIAQQNVMEPITKVDWCFETKTKTNGYLLYNSHDINSIIKEKNAP